MSDEKPVYEEIGPVSKDDAEAAFTSGDGPRIGRALLSLALNGEDWEYAERRCLDFITHADVWVRRNACTSLGHLARLHGSLHLDRVFPALLAARADPETRGYAEDALSDIRVFMDVDPRSWLK